MSKPEATFIRYINSRIDRTIHVQSMYTPYSAGTPDNYYETNRQTLWVEYKYARAVPRLYPLGKKVTALQAAWLNRAVDNNHRVWVVVGFGDTEVAVFTNKEWVHSYTKEEICARMLTRAPVYTTNKQYADT